jgi:hypothetical protein
MDQYKPNFLGKVMPTDKPEKINKFVANQYNAFSKAYDTCKGQAEHITDVKVVESTDPTSLSIKVSADEETMAKIKENADSDVSVDGNLVTAKGSTL